MITFTESAATSVITDALDLALGRACAVCDVPGRALCAPCLEDIRCVPSPLALSPLQASAITLPSLPRLSATTNQVAHHPDDLPPGRYAVPYRGAPSSLILDYKERGNRALAAGLGLLLADAVEALIEQDLTARRPRSIALIPVPGRPRPRRGFPALPGLVRPAVRSLRAAGHDVQMRSLLTHVGHHGALKGMDRTQRRRAVSGSMAARRRPVARHGSPSAQFVIVDDVVTTGSTMLEAIRAARAAGLTVVGCAAIAHSERE